MKKTPKRAQTPAIAKANGLKGKRNSPWGRGAMIPTETNSNRHKEWKDDSKT